jgi:hypothetical protein
LTGPACAGHREHAIRAVGRDQPLRGAISPSGEVSRQPGRAAPGRPGGGRRDDDRGRAAQAAGTGRTDCAGRSCWEVAGAAPSGDRAADEDERAVVEGVESSPPTAGLAMG